MKLWRGGQGEYVGPLAAGVEGAADAGALLHAVHDLPVLQAAYDDVVAAALGVESAGPAVAGGLHDDDLADVLALLVGVVDEQVGERPEEPAGAELEDGFGERGHGGPGVGVGSRSQPRKWVERSVTTADTAVDRLGSEPYPRPGRNRLLPGDLLVPGDRTAITVHIPGLRDRAALDRWAPGSLHTPSESPRRKVALMSTGTLQSLLAGFDPELPLDRAKTIPNTWYTDPRVYEAERYAVFGSSWQMVGRAEQVARAGAVPHRRRRRRPGAGRPRRGRRAAGVLQRLPAPGGPDPERSRAARRRSCGAATTGGPTTSTGRLRGTPEFDGVATSARRTTASSRSAVAEWGPFVWVHLDPPRTPGGVPRSVTRRGWAAEGVRRTGVSPAGRATTWRATGRCTSITTWTAGTT